MYSMNLLVYSVLISDHPQGKSKHKFVFPLFFTKKIIDIIGYKIQAMVVRNIIH